VRTLRAMCTMYINDVHKVHRVILAETEPIPNSR
jgi:hypothetical protein